MHNARRHTTQPVRRHVSDFFKARIEIEVQRVFKLGERLTNDGDHRFTQHAISHKAQSIITHCPTSQLCYAATTPRCSKSFRYSARFAASELLAGIDARRRRQKLSRSARRCCFDVPRRVALAATRVPIDFAGVKGNAPPFRIAPEHTRGLRTCPEFTSA